MRYVIINENFPRTKVPIVRIVYRGRLSFRVYTPNKTRCYLDVKAFYFNIAGINAIQRIYKQSKYQYSPEFINLSIFSIYICNG